MEYIKKEELIKGEIYTHKNGNIFRCDQINNKTIYGKYINITHNVFRKPPENPGNFWINKIRLATPEEKHWLNCCITANKFITFEEAMKTFIPEYVELINTGCRINCNIPAGKIYKCSKDVTKSYHFGFFLDSKYRIGFNKNEFNQYLKPSTKEAYDAQFVVKEPEFVLPEKWQIKRTEENHEIINNWMNNHHKDKITYGTTDYTSYKYFANNFNLSKLVNKEKGVIEITFEQFKKYVLKDEIVEKKVIEPLPQFKIIETIETITKVENNEGNQFFIGDVVKSEPNFIQTIKSFKYNTNKTKLMAVTSRFTIDGININKIEHYIEPKTDYKILEYKTESGISCKAPFLADSHQFYINERCKIYSIKRISDDLIITVGDEVLSKTCGVPNKILSIELINNKIRLYPRNSFYNLEDIIKVKEETLLDKAKKLYPVGTKFRVACKPEYIGTVKDHKDYPFQSVDIVNLNTIENIDDCTGMTVFYKGKWAEIINE